MTKLLFSIALLIGLGEVCASVIVVDANGHGDYTSISDGISNSTSGDTIYVTGASASYGNFSLNSPRTFIGNGYYGQSLGYTAASTIGNITLNSGASATVFSNLEIGNITFNESTITFDACRIYGSFSVGSSISNITYRKCLFTSTLSLQSASVTFENCIFNYASAGNMITVTTVGVSFDYCTFYDGNLSLNTSTINNSIVNSTRVVQSPVVATDGAGGNKVDTESNLLFEVTLGQDAFFQLQPGSPGKTSSTEASESGAFGFPSAQPEDIYRLSGLPTIPKITLLEHASTGNTGSNLSIRVQATN